jgi:hypothetical protein
MSARFKATEKDERLFECGEAEIISRPALKFGVRHLGELGGGRSRRRQGLLPVLRQHSEMRMRRTRQIAIGVVWAAAFFTAVPAALAQDPSLDAAKAVLASIHRIDAGGYWARGKEEGFFRIVVIATGVEHVVHRLYLQWLTVDPDSQEYRVVRTTSVKEINEGHSSVLEVKPDFADMGRLKVAITAKPRGGGPLKQFDLTAQADGTYSLRAR